MESSGLLIVSGPIVRRVDQSSASVFVVTRHPREVELTVYANNGGTTGPQVLRGKRKTIALGANLHAVVVTARGDNALTWGASYHYDLTFSGDGRTQSLRDDGVLVASQADAGPLERLVYNGQERPGFVLPPTDPARLRVFHGSCRKPHGGGVDALAQVDDRLAAALADASAIRPQQLFLTGDQIYADDVNRKLLSSLRAFAHNMIGRAEEDTDLRADAQNLEPGKRTPLCKAAGLSTTESECQLITLGEFYAMYSSVWSLEPWRGSAEGEAARKELSEFTAKLPFVRRALANIATYMVPDDHEVSDDWFIHEKWCDDVLGKPLGRRIVRNGMAAYTVFQHWGNDPDQATPDHPLGRALAAIDGWDGTVATIGKLDTILPVPPRGADLASPTPERISMAWRWSSPAYEVIGLDTRTRRQFTPHHTSLMSTTEIDRVLAGDPRSFTIVLSAAPVLGVGLLECVQKLAAHAKTRWADKVDAEPWSNGKEAYEYLIKRLLARSPVIVLSGDVHYGFGASLFNKDDPSTRIVNFTSSSLKNMPSIPMLAGLWTLGASTNNRLERSQPIALDGLSSEEAAAAEKGLSEPAWSRTPDGRPIVLETQTVRTIAGQPFQEEVMVDLSAIVDRPQPVLEDLLARALEDSLAPEDALPRGDALPLGDALPRGGTRALEYALGSDRTDLTGLCNVGELRFRPGENQAVHVVWNKFGRRWRQTEHTATFVIEQAPDGNTIDVTQEFVGDTFYVAFTDQGVTRYMSWTEGFDKYKDNRRWGTWSPKQDTSLTIEKVGELYYLKQGALYLSWDGRKQGLVHKLTDGRKWAIWSPEKDTPITITRDVVTGLYFLRNKEKGFSVLSWDKGFKTISSGFKLLDGNRKWSTWSAAKVTPITIVR